MFESNASCTRAFVVATVFGATALTYFPCTATVLPAGSLAVAQTGNALVLSFPTTTPRVYDVLACSDLRQWTNVQAGIIGDGTVKTVSLSNVVSRDVGFYRLLIQTPLSLSLPQATAFSILGHSCGGIQEHVYLTGFDPTNGYPMGDVYMSTTCSTGGRGSVPATYTAWAAVTWDFAGNVLSATALSNAPSVSSTFAATDTYTDTIYNNGTVAYLAVPTPAAPTGVTAVQSGDEFLVSWTPNGVAPDAIASSTLTATPVNSTNAVLTAVVSGTAENGVIASLQPQTTYQVTVVNTTVGGTGPASTPVQVTTSPATIAPSAPTGVTASWTDLNPTGTTDTLVATWQAANPGNSPVDAYLVTIVGSDGGGTFTQTVSGTTLTASFTVDYIPNWSVTVKAHNAAGWGPASTPVTLGGL